MKFNPRRSKTFFAEFFTNFSKIDLSKLKKIISENIYGRIRLVWEKISRYVNKYNIYHFKQVLKIYIDSALNNLSGHQKKIKKKVKYGH